MAPAQYPQCSGTRNLHDNLSDLRAQVAANQKVCIHATRQCLVYLTSVIQDTGCDVFLGIVEDYLTRML